MSLREMARRTTQYFWDAISALGDPLSLRLIAAVMRGRATSLLELDDRPAAYDDVGRLCTWDDLFPVARLARSRYERVLVHAISGRRVRIAGLWHRPVGMRGWTHVVFRRERDGTRHALSLDDLLVHLDEWDRSGDRRGNERRATPEVGILAERRTGDPRRGLVADAKERQRESDAVEAVPNADMPTAEAVSPQKIKPQAESPLVIIARI
jgi:hypothetical protein